jgi:hypothetical protein
MPDRAMTEADELTFEITFPGPDVNPKPFTVKAAYPTTDDRLAGWTLFKDHRHKTVAMIPTGAAQLVRCIEAKPAGAR